MSYTSEKGYPKQTKYTHKVYDPTCQGDYEVIFRYQFSHQ